MTRMASRPRVASITACGSEPRVNKKGQGFAPLASCFVCLARQVTFTVPLRISASATTATTKSSATPVRSYWVNMG